MPATPHTTRNRKHSAGGANEDPRRWKNAEKGGDAEDLYREAVEKRGSIRGVADELNVSRQTVKEQMARYDIENPQTGRVPNATGTNRTS